MFWGFIVALGRIVSQAWPTLSFTFVLIFVVVVVFKTLTFYIAFTFEDSEI